MASAVYHCDQMVGIMSDSSWRGDRWKCSTGDGPEVSFPSLPSAGIFILEIENSMDRKRHSYIIF